MHVSIIGSNGLLSSCVGIYCNSQSFELSVYGRTEPQHHTYTSFHKVDLLKDELNYEELLRSDIIIYTAGAGIQSILNDKSDFIYRLNVLVPIAICNALRDAGYSKTFMSFGSYSEIGENVDNRAFNELDLLYSENKAPNDYTISKRLLSRFFSSFSASYTFLHFVLPTIYGETEATHRLIPYTLKSIADNVTLQFTSGEQIRQYIYIDDVVKILFKALDVKLSSGIYNIGGTEDFSVKELVTLLFELNNQCLPLNVFGKAERSDVGMKVLRLNGDKLFTSLNYLPTVKVSEVYSKYNFKKNE
jgi:nucleoside-diphosphate-sugar epimerase